MSDELLPKTFYGEIQVEKRSQVGQKKRCKHTFKVFFKNFNIPPESWKEIVNDQAKWRCLIRKEPFDYEAKRVREAEQKAQSQSKGIIISDVSFRIDLLYLQQTV